jgi:hypothetical protein
MRDLGDFPPAYGLTAMKIAAATMVTPATSPIETDNHSGMVFLQYRAIAEVYVNWIAGFL